MSIAYIMFYFFMASAAITSLALLFIRNVLHGALLLIVTLLSLAGLYILCFAEFIAMTQILVYAGGVLVVIIFAIMLTSRLSGEPLKIGHDNIFYGIIAGGSFSGILFCLISGESAIQDGTAVHTSTLPDFGVLLMTRYALPFEIAGIVLLIALIGAAVMASTTPSNPK